MLCDSETCHEDLLLNLTPQLLDKSQGIILSCTPTSEEAITGSRDVSSTTVPDPQEAQRQSATFNNCDQPRSSTPRPRARKNVYTPRTERRIARLRDKVSKYRKALNRLKDKQQKKDVTKQDALHVMKRFIPERLFLLLLSHIELLHVNKYGRRWSPEMKKFSMDLYFHGPKAYRFIALNMNLPSVRTIKRWLSNIAMRPGIIPGVMNTIKKATENWTRQDRICCMMFDEMSISQLLQYDIKQDIITGFADNAMERTPRVANVALVVMLSSISKSWVQPVAYVIAHNATPPGVIHRLVNDIISQLQAADILVKAIICDQASNNVAVSAVSTQRNVSPEKPYFTHNGEKIYFLFDTPHLIKCVRNNLRHHILHIGSEVVDWAHIVAMYENAHPLRTRLAPDLTDKHVYKVPFGDMNVRRAAQVLSSTVALALLVLVSLNELPAAARSTADFLKKVDQLFDALNSSSTLKKGSKLRYAMSEHSEHVEFLKGCLPWLERWRFDSPRQPHTIRGLKITIKGVLLLWEELHVSYGFPYLLTRRLQQDPLEYFFGMMRQQHGCNEHPSVFQFTSGLKHLFVSKLMKLSKQGNCEDDTSVMLADLAAENNSSELQISVLAPPCATHSTATDQAASASVTSGACWGIVDSNVLYYVAGCLVKDFLNASPNGCVCKRFLQPEDEAELNDTYQFFSLLKAHDIPNELFGNLTTPSRECFEHVQQMEATFLNIIGCVAHLPGVCKVLCKELKKDNALFCSPACNSRFVEHYVHIRLKCHLRFVNRSLKTSKSKHTAAARKARKLTRHHTTT